MKHVVCLPEQNSKLLVYGYIRQSFNENCALPTDVINLCLKWYFARIDKWDLDCSNTHKLDIDILSGIVILRDVISDYKTAIGSNIISKYVLEHIWKVKYIHSLISICFLSLGLVLACINGKESHKSVYQLGYGLHPYQTQK